MLKDKMGVWATEYVAGGLLVVLPLIGLALWLAGKTHICVWAVLLFGVCLGVILISCASSMRQRMELANRIEALAKRMAEKPASSGESGETES